MKRGMRPGPRAGHPGNGRKGYPSCGAHRQFSFPPPVPLVRTKLRKDVWALGGNAIIGIDLDYTMFGNSLVGVIASGTAVIIARQD